MADAYTHNVIDHAEEYVRGHIHTNGMENFWSLLKRALKGTYVSVEPFHLFRYVDEEVFRFKQAARRRWPTVRSGDRRNHRPARDLQAIDREDARASVEATSWGRNGHTHRP